jgi:hypothetical protein
MLQRKFILLTNATYPHLFSTDPESPKTRAPICATPAKLHESDGSEILIFEEKILHLERKCLIVTVNL